MLLLRSYWSGPILKAGQDTIMMLPRHGAGW